MKTYQLKFLAWTFSAFLSPDDPDAEPDAEDYYDLLGVSRSVKPDELKKAYRKKSLQLHPDKLRQRGMKYDGQVITEDEARARFQTMKQAYDTLNDPKKRQIYDALGHKGMDFVINPAHAYDPHVLMGNLAKSSVFDRTKLMALVCAFFGMVLLQPILICAKVDQMLARNGQALEGSSWVAIFVPFWLYSIFFGVILVVGKAWLQLAHWTCFVVGILFLTLRWDEIIDWDYAAVFAPLYLWMAIRIIEAKQGVDEVTKDMSRMVTIDYVEKFIINEKKQDEDGNDIEQGDLHRNYNDLNEEERDKINEDYIIVHVPPKTSMPGGDEEEEDELDQIERSPEYQEARARYMEASKSLQRIFLPEIPLIVLIVVQLDLNKGWDWGLTFLPLWIAMVLECCGGCYGFFCMSALAHIEVQEQMEEHMAKQQEEKETADNEARAKEEAATKAKLDAPLPDVSSMSIAQMREELTLRKVDHTGFCEKSEFTTALQKARGAKSDEDAENAAQSNGTSPVTATATSEDGATAEPAAAEAVEANGIDVAFAVEPPKPAAVAANTAEASDAKPPGGEEDDDDDFEFEMDEETFHYYQQAEVEAESKATEAQAKAIGSFCNILGQALIAGLFVGKLNQVYAEQDELPEGENSTASFSTFWILFPFLLVAGCFLSCFCCAIFCASDIDNVISTNEGDGATGDAAEEGAEASGEGGSSPEAPAAASSPVILTPPTAPAAPAEATPEAKSDDPPEKKDNPDPPTETADTDMDDLD